MKQIKKIKHNRLIVTTSWDDGHKKDVRLAKLLARYGIKGTFYITKNFPNSLEKHEVLEIDEKHEIGGHNINHSDLTKLSLSKAESEIKGSKEYIENLLDHEIKVFCYPYGKYNENIKKIVKEAGFIAARTANHGDFDFPQDPFECQITLHTSNGSPRTTLQIWKKNKLPFKALIDWEIRAKLLFDLALKKGGIYHLWGHSWEIESHMDWEKLERILNYISNKKNVYYLTNSQIFNNMKHVNNYNNITDEDR